MNNTRMAIMGTLTGDQFIALAQIITTGAVIITLAFGAYKYRYTLQGSYNGVNGIDITLNPPVGTGNAKSRTFGNGSAE